MKATRAGVFLNCKVNLITRQTAEIKLRPYLVTFQTTVVKGLSDMLLSLRQWPKRAAASGTDFLLYYDVKILN